MSETKKASTNGHGKGHGHAHAASENGLEQELENGFGAEAIESIEDLGGAAPENAGETPEQERLQLELDTARRRVDELARAYQAVNQDKEEFKQRIARERERMIDVEKGKVAVALLEAIDELDRCLDASPGDQSPLAKGVRLIRDNLLAKAQASGLERLDLVGKPYDPNVAEAVDMEITTDPAQDQVVLAELTAGYRLKDRIVRPARVKVAKFVQPARA